MPTIYLTVPEVAKHFGCAPWKVRRLYERGVFPNPKRAALTRLIDEADLPKIEQALRDAGYLKSEPTAA